MFSDNSNWSISPPPGTKPRNESFISALPTYRNRPSGMKDTASTFNACTSFVRTMSKPEVRSSLALLAQNPIAQKVISSAATEAFKQHNPAPIQSKCVAPIQTAASRPTPLNNFDDILNSLPIRQPLPPPGEFFYKKLTQQDPFNFPPQQPSPKNNEPKIIDVDEGTSSSWPWQIPSSNGFYRSDRMAPARPPPPKFQQHSQSQPLFDPDLTAAFSFASNEAHAVALYPYRAEKFEELSSEAGDVLHLKREVDSDWILATNNRTGMTGLTPLSYMQIQVPLNSFSTSSPSSSHHIFPVKVIASYDYDSGVRGDLKFKAGDPIIVFSRANNEWIHGELDGKHGLVPMNYVQANIDEIYTLPINSSSSEIHWPLNQWKIAIYDYSGEVADDLEFKAGDLIKVLHERGNNWVLGQLKNGQVGLVPLTYCR